MMPVASFAKTSCVPARVCIYDHRMLVMHMYDVCIFIIQHLRHQLNIIFQTTFNNEHQKDAFCESLSLSLSLSLHCPRANISSMY